MIINLDYKLSFLCTPKCASTSIEKFMGNSERIELTGSPQMKHCDATFYKNKMKPFLTSAFPNSEFVSFALIREPISWLSSWWRYLQRPNASKRFNTNNISFNDYVLNFMKPLDQRQPGTGTRFKYPRSWIIDDVGCVVVDKVFSLDKIEELEAFLTLHTGTKVLLDTLNKSTNEEFITPLSLPDSTIKIVNEVMKIEYQLYDSAMVSPDHCKLQNFFYT